MKNSKQGLEEYLEEHLLRRKYSESTRIAYRYWVFRICEYFGVYSSDEFDINDVSAFIRDLEDRQQFAASSIKQAENALHFFFNTLGKRGLEIKGLGAKKVKRWSSAYVPTQKEILSIIDNIQTERTRLAVMLGYSAGLDVDELVNLSVGDIDFEKNVIRISLKRKKGVRNAVLADYVKPLLYSYLRETQPIKWVLESRDKKQISASAIQRGVKKAANKAGLEEEITAKSLKYAYVKHLHQLGISVPGILDELRLSHRSSLEFYSRLVEPVDKVMISPMDRRVPEEHFTAKPSPQALYISDVRINELADIKQSEYDFTKLLELLREVNSAYTSGMHFSIGALVRAILDHVPPVFGFKYFSEVANNYHGGTSFKKTMQRLDNSLRNVANSLLHSQIRHSEVLPVFQRVDFRSDLDVLLGEIVRISRSSS